MHNLLAFTEAFYAIKFQHIIMSNIRTIEKLHGTYDFNTFGWSHLKKYYIYERCEKQLFAHVKPEKTIVESGSVDTWTYEWRVVT
jgi:hypothetical protein